MVGSLMLWKLMHCKRLKTRSSKNIKKEKDFDLPVSSTDPLFTAKIEVTEANQTCRVCLKTGEIPIYDDNRTEDISDALINFGGIEITPDDEYPKFLCKSCYALLQGAILFRKTAQNSDQLLRMPQKVSDNESGNITDKSFYYDIKEKDRKKYVCKKCDIDFDTFSEYNEHKLSEEHENLKRTCPICNNSYSSVYIKKHMAIHTLETSHVCDICGKKFIVKGLFTRHRQTHFNNFPFSCSLCPYKGRFKESLKMHMRHHTGEKRYQCTQCPSKFVHKSNLNKHILTHKGFDFKCEICGRGFYNKRSLEQHFKVDHTGVKDHVCNICGKAFGYRKQMMKHQLRVHKREKFKSGRMPLYLQLENKKLIQNETYEVPLI